ncbi:MAG: hypothetical protein LBM71_02885, partial [Elusimicrobiota bacterium]|nr:hypothetical protein [Elusimicrobiota bacterium]
MDLFLRILLCLLMLFATLSFAGTEPWAQAILQSAAAASLILFLFSRRKIYLTPLLKPLLFIFGLIIFLAALQAVAPITILDNVPLRPHTFVRLYTLEAISYFFSLAIIILLASNLFDTRRQVATAVKTFALCVFIIGIISFSFPGKGYIYFFTGVIGDIGPFLNRNHGGIFFAMGSLLALTYTVYRYFIFKSGEWSGSKQQFYICQIMWCIVALCLMLTAIFTRSRGAMLSLAAGLAMYSLLMALFLSKTSKTRFKNTATVLVITAVVAFAAYFNV